MKHDAICSPARPLAAVAAAVVAVLLGCSSSAAPVAAGAVDGSAPDGPAVGDAGPTFDRDASPGDAATEAACMLSTLPILANASEQDFAVPVLHDGQEAALLIDTGSPITYLWLPLHDGGLPDAGDAGGFDLDAAIGADADAWDLPDAGSVTLGCETRPMGGLAQVAELPVDGRSVVGTIGDDSLLAAPTWLDLAGHQLVFHARGDGFSQATSWPATAFTRPAGYVRVEDVSFNGKAVKLLLDTGSPDCLWLGEQPAPGDVEIMGEDANGDPVALYQSTVTVSVGSWSRTVQVYKAPSFPYFQPLATAVGVVGLFGVSAFPDGVVFDTDAARVRIAP